MSVKLRDNARYARFLLGSMCFAGLIFSPCPRGLPAAAASSAQSDRGFSVRVEVELVTAEVIVLDKKGRPVHNLKKEDFRLYEDGKQQEIASFDEVEEDSGEELITDLAGRNGDFRRGKTVLILFDDSTIASAHLKSTRDSAENFVKEHMRPQDLFAVTSYNQSLQVLQNFTDDVEKVLAAIRRPAVSGRTNQQASTLEQLQPAQGRNRAAPETLDPFAKYQAESFFRALYYMNLSVERVRGRKCVLLFSEDLSLSEDSRPLFSNTVDSAKKANVVFYTIDARGLDSNQFGEARSPVKDPQSYASTKTAREVSAPVPSIFRQLPGLLSSSTSGIQSGFRTAMFQQGGGGTGGGTGSGSGGGGTGSTGGGTGGGTGSSGTGGGRGGGAGSGSTGATYPGNAANPGYGTGRNNPSGMSGFGNTGPDFGMNSMRMEQNALRSLATETGGFAIYNTADFDGELAKLDQKLSNYYILGFQSKNPKRDGSFRKLQVKTDLKGLTLMYRKGYVDPRPLDTLANSKREKSLLKAMASPAAATQLPLVFRAAYFYDSPRLARVLVSARIDMEKAKFKKKGGQLTCDLNVMGAAYSENDSVSARFSETVPVSIDREKEKNAGKNLVYSNYFKLRPGKYRLKLAASDEENNLGSVEQVLEIPSLPENGIAGSSLVIAERVSQLPALIQNLQAKLLDDRDPLVYAGLQVSPSIDNKLPVDSPLPVVFKLYSPAGGLDHWKMAAKARLLRDTGEELSIAPVTLEGDQPQSDRTEATVGFNLTFRGMTPGKYKLVIDLTDAASSQTAKVQTDVEFVKN